MKAIPSLGANGIVVFGIDRGRSYDVGVMVCGNARWSTDAVANTTVTFDGVIAGSEIRVYDASRNELAGIESCAANQQLTWPVYASGSPNNNVYITILLRGYRIMKFHFTSKIGSQNLPIFMITDLGYSNPA